MNKPQEPQYPEKIQGLTYYMWIQNPDGTISVDGRVDLRQDPSKKLISADEVGERFVMYKKSMKEITEALYTVLLPTTSIYKGDVVELHNAKVEYDQGLEEYKRWENEEEIKQQKIKERIEKENTIVFPDIDYSYKYNTGTGNLNFKGSFCRHKNVSQEIQKLWNPYFDKFDQGVTDAFKKIKSRENMQDGLMARKAYEYGFYFGHGVIVGKSNGMNGKSSSYGKPYNDNNKDQAYEEGYDVGYKVGEDIYYDRRKTRVIVRRGGDDNAFSPQGEDKVIRAAAAMGSFGGTEIIRLFDKDLFNI